MSWVSRVGEGIVSFLVFEISVSEILYIKDKRRRKKIISNQYELRKDVVVIGEEKVNKVGSPVGNVDLSHLLLRRSHKRWPKNDPDVLVVHEVEGRVGRELLEEGKQHREDLSVRECEQIEQAHRLPAPTLFVHLEHLQEGRVVVVCHQRHRHVPEKLFQE